MSVNTDGLATFFLKGTELSLTCYTLETRHGAGRRPMQTLEAVEAVQGVHIFVKNAFAFPSINTLNQHAKLSR